MDFRKKGWFSYFFCAFHQLLFIEEQDGGFIPPNVRQKRKRRSKFVDRGVAGE